MTTKQVCFVTNLCSVLVVRVRLASLGRPRCFACFFFPGQACADNNPCSSWEKKNVTHRGRPREAKRTHPVCVVAYFDCNVQSYWAFCSQEPNDQLRYTINPGISEQLRNKQISETTQPQKSNQQQNSFFLIAIRPYLALKVLINTDKLLRQ